LFLVGELFCEVDLVMYCVKGVGCDRIVVYDSQLYVEVESRLVIECRFCSVIEWGCLSVVY